MATNTNTIPLFDGKDFLGWKRNIQNVLLVHNLWLLTKPNESGDGPTETIPPDSQDPEQGRADYMRRANLALALINMSLHSCLRSITKNLSTPWEAYKAICTRFEAYDACRQFMYFHQLLHLHMDESKPLQVYLCRVDDFIELLEDEQHKFKDTWRIGFYLQGLPSSYDPVKTIIRATPNITIKRALKILLSHESFLKYDNTHNTQRGAHHSPRDLQHNGWRPNRRSPQRSGCCQRSTSRPRRRPSQAQPTTSGTNNRPPYNPNASYRQYCSSSLSSHWPGTSSRPRVSLKKGVLL